MAGEICWLTPDDVHEIHDDQIQTFGGPEGIRDVGLVESAVAAPKNLFLYEGIEDVLALGLRLCMAIAKNHGYVDGNKRTAAAAMLEFMAINGYWLSIDDDDEEHPPLGVLIEQGVTGSMSEANLYAILQPHMVELASDDGE